MEILERGLAGDLEKVIRVFLAFGRFGTFCPKVIQCIFAIFLKSSDPVFVKGFQKIFEAFWL